jgi:hypothetical protein
MWPIKGGLESIAGGLAENVPCSLADIAEKRAFDRALSLPPQPNLTVLLSLSLQTGRKTATEVALDCSDAQLPQQPENSKLEVMCLSFDR